MKEIAELKLPDDALYSDDHEWARREGETVRVGISDYAQDRLGDITFVEMPAMGATFQRNEEFGTVESTKAVSELLMPVGGEIVAVNEALEESSDLLNQDPYGDGWIIEVKPHDLSELDLLMTKEDYVKTLLQNVSSKCIVFANTQKQADKIYQHSYHSANPMSTHNLELFSDGRITKLSCVLQLNEGVTIPNLKAGIIMHAYGNERKTSQRIGRLLRLNPNEKSTCHILCYKNTVDEKWVEDALKDLDPEKIKYYNPLTD